MLVYVTSKCEKGRHQGTKKKKEEILPWKQAHVKQSYFFPKYRPSITVFKVMLLQYCGM